MRVDELIINYLVPYKKSNLKGVVFMKRFKFVSIIMFALSAHVALLRTGVWGRLATNEPENDRVIFPLAGNYAVIFPCLPKRIYTKMATFAVAN